MSVLPLSGILGKRKISTWEIVIEYVKCRAVLFIVGWSASLACADVTTRKVFRHCQMSLGKQNCLLENYSLQGFIYSFNAEFESLVWII